MLFRCPWAFSGLFRPVFERVVSQILRDLRMVWSCRENLVTFPAAERNHANPQPASRFRLEYLQLETASPEVAANGGRLLWDLNATVAG
jgi:hypothetical protein